MARVAATWSTCAHDVQGAQARSVPEGGPKLPLVARHSAVAPPPDRARARARLRLGFRPSCASRTLLRPDFIEVLVEMRLEERPRQLLRTDGRRRPRRFFPWAFASPADRDLILPRQRKSSQKHAPTPSTSVVRQSRPSGQTLGPNRSQSLAHCVPWPVTKQARPGAQSETEPGVSWPHGPPCWV